MYELEEATTKINLRKATRHVTAPTMIRYLEYQKKEILKIISNKMKTGIVPLD